MAAPAEEFREIRLVDILRVVHQRKLVLAGVLIVAILAGVALTAFASPEYEASATVVPLEFEDIISNWLSSRHAAELVLDDLGSRLSSSLLPSRWDTGAQNWTGAPPSREELGAALATDHVAVASQAAARSGGQRLITVKVTLGDPLLARDVANAYVETLGDLRPHLENITRQEAFDKYYTGTNQLEAQQRAETTARQKDYWLVLDSATPPTSPVRPNAVLNVGVAAAAGAVLGLLAVFGLEWLSAYRAELRAVELPPPASEVPVDEIQPPRRGRFNR